AHASSYNVGSFGISVMGNFNNVDAPQATYETLADAIAWKAAIHGFDPLGTTDRTAKGSYVRTITGHRDVGSTSCPGLISDKLWWLRLEAADRAPSMPATGPGPAADDRFFSDMPTTATHHEQVMTVHETGVLLGYTSSAPARFLPGTALNRGDMARAVAIAMDLEPVTDWRGRFKDVNDTQEGRYWLGPYIVALVDAGVVQGYDDGTFRPGAPLRRDQMATFLAKALKLPTSTPHFDDVKNTTSPHYGNIGAVQKYGIARGATARTYDPGGTMRRDQSASLLVNAFDIERPPPPEPEPEPTEPTDEVGEFDESGDEVTDGTDDGSGTGSN
ncbi:MAG: S-layer homology domain-containing protein, partial [Egicoccus sp.]